MRGDPPKLDLAQAEPVEHLRNAIEGIVLKAEVGSDQLIESKR